MGQSSSKRRSYTPGVNKNTEIASAPLDNGDDTNGSIRVHQIGDLNQIEENGFGISSSSSAATPTSSAGPTGKTDKRKRFRVSFPLRRTPSGRWSRKKRSQSQNGVRTTTIVSHIEEEQRDTTGSPIQAMDTQTPGGQSEVANLHNNDERKSEPRENQLPASKTSDKTKSKRGSQRSSGRKKKKDKENSKKEKTKKKQKSGEKRGQKHETRRELELQEMKEKDTEILQEVEVTDRVTSLTAHSDPVVEIESTPSAIAVETDLKAHMNLEADPFKGNAGGAELVSENIIDSFSPNIADITENEPLIFEIERELHFVKPGTTNLNDSDYTSFRSEISPKHENELDTQPELQLSTFDRDALPENVDASSSHHRNIESIFTASMFSATERTAEPDSFMEEPEMKAQVLEMFRDSVKISDDTNDTSGDSAQTLDTNNHTTVRSDYLHIVSDSDLGNYKKDIRTSIPFNDSTSKEDISCEHNIFGDLPESWSNWRTTQSPFQFGNEDTEQMNEETSDGAYVVTDDIEYEEIGVKASPARDDEDVARETVELVLAAAVEIVDGKEDYEDVEVNAMKAQEELRCDPDKCRSELEVGVKTISDHEQEKEETKLLDSQNGTKEGQEEGNTSDVNREAKHDSKQHAADKIDKERSKGETCLNLQKRLSNWLHKKDDHSKSIESEEITRGADDEVSAADLDKPEQNSTSPDNDEVMESIVTPMEKASMELIPANSPFPGKASLTLDISTTPRFDPVSNELSTNSDEANTSTSISPTSSPVHSATPTSPSSAGEKSKGPGFLKKISIGSRLHTAILRKKSSSDASDTDQEVKRISLTRPKSIEITHLTPPPRKSHTIVQYSHISEDTHNEVYSSDINTHPQEGNSKSAQEHSVQSTSLDLNLNDSGIADLASPTGIKPAEHLEFSRNCPEEAVKAAMFNCISLEPVAEQLTEDKIDAKEKSMVNVNLFDNEDEQCPLLDLDESNDETAFAALIDDTGNSKVVLSEKNVQIGYNKENMPDPDGGIDAGRFATTETEVLPSEDSNELFNVNFFSPTTPEQIRFQDAAFSELNKSDDFVMKCGKCDADETEVIASNNILASDTSEIPHGVIPAVVGLSCSLSSTPQPTSSNITEDIVPSLWQSPLDTSTTLEDDHRYQPLEKQCSTDTINPQASSPSEVLKPVHDDQIVRCESKNRELCSEDHQQEIHSQKHGHRPARTIAEYHIGVTSDLLNGQPEYIEPKEYQTGMCNEALAITCSDEGNLKISTINETTTKSDLPLLHEEDNSDTCADSSSRDNILTNQDIPEIDLLSHENGETIKFNNNTLHNSYETNNDFREETTGTIQYNKKEELTCGCVTRLDNDVDSHFRTSENGNVTSGVSNYVNGAVSDDDNSRDIINDKENTTSCISHGSRFDSGIITGNGSKNGPGDTIDAYLKVQYSNNGDDFIMTSQKLKHSVTNDNEEDNSICESADV